MARTRPDRPPWSPRRALGNRGGLGGGVAWLEANFARFLRGRLSRLRLAALLVAQITLATSLSWGLAHALISPEVAVFAPIAALITLAVAMTQRLRRILALIAGFAVGVFVGDLIVTASGTGVWQVALIVAVSMIIAILVGGATTLVVPAAAIGVIIASITPVNDLVLDRVYDVLIGSAIGILVSTILLPFNPIVIARRAADRMLTELAQALADLAEALRIHADTSVRAASERVHAVEGPLREFDEAITTATETARLAPFRWRSHDRVQPYLGLAERMDHVMHNLRVLTRRSRAILSQEESVPSAVPDALDGMGRAVRLLLADLLADQVPERARSEVLRAVRVTADVPQGMSVSTQVVVVRLRSTAVDLLRACGLSYADADGAVRGAVTGPRLRPGETLLSPVSHIPGTIPARRRAERIPVAALSLGRWGRGAVPGVAVTAAPGSGGCPSPSLGAGGWIGRRCGRGSRPCRPPRP